MKARFQFRLDPRQRHQTAISCLLGEIHTRLEDVQAELHRALEHDLEPLALTDASDRARDLADAIDLLTRLASQADA